MRRIDRRDAAPFGFDEEHSPFGIRPILPSQLSTASDTIDTITRIDETLAITTVSLSVTNFDDACIFDVSQILQTLNTLHAPILCIDIEMLHLHPRKLRRDKGIQSLYVLALHVSTWQFHFSMRRVYSLFTDYYVLMKYIQSLDPSKVPFYGAFDALPSDFETNTFSSFGHNIFLLFGNY